MSEFVMPAAMRMGPVALRVRDLEQTLGYYVRVVGLQTVAREAHRAVLGAPREAGGVTEEIVRLEEDPSAPRPPQGAPGLYHVAIRLPERSALARLVKHLRGHADTPFGASDHGVSEALYMEDPEGNGVEVYADRAPADWPHDDRGQLAMTTAHLNLRDLLALAPEGTAPWDTAPPGTAVGHVHLKVAALGAAEEFYHSTLGLAVTSRYPGALFFSAGGYHHHIAANTWSSAGGVPPPKGALGLAYLTIALPTAADLEALTMQLAQHGVPLEATDDGWLVRDPSGDHLHVVQQTP